MTQLSPPISSGEMQAQPMGQEGFAAGGIAQQLDLRRIYLAFRRRLRLLSAVALAVFVAVVLVTLQATPKYTATANVLLDTRKEKVSDVQEVLSGLPADSATVDTEVEVIKSRQLAERVT